MSEQLVKVELTEVERVIQEIMNLAFLVNQRTDKCVFVRYAGHVDLLEVDIRNSKENYNSKYCGSEIYRATETLGELENVRINLIKLLRDGKLDLSELDYTVEEIRHYQL